MYSFDTIIDKGRYKFYRLGDIPATYFMTIWENQKGGGEPNMKEFITTNLNLIKERKNLMLSPKLGKKFICTKRYFPTKQDAKNSLSKIREVNQTEDRPVRAYECEYCSGWHLTSMPIEIFKEKF